MAHQTNYITNGKSSEGQVCGLGGYGDVAWQKPSVALGYQPPGKAVSQLRTSERPGRGVPYHDILEPGIQSKQAHL